MDFFKSLVSDDPDPPRPENPDSPTNQSESDHESNDDQLDGDGNSNGDGDGDGGGLWSFGGLMQTIATRSESVILTYRRDLEEFRTGLQKETELFREVASKAVKDLPASIDLAHGKIDGVFKSTAEIISHGRDSLLAASDEEGEMETPEISRRSSVGFSRFEAQLSAIQNDVKTYTEEVEDLEEYGKWKLGFGLVDKGEEIVNLIGENGVLEGVYKGIVPNQVDNETFWFRYFYRVHKLKQQESVRAKLVKRAISIDEEEELSWDVDDTEEEEEDDHENVGETSVVKEKGDELENEKGNELDKKKDISEHKDEFLNVSAESVGKDTNVESASDENAVGLKSRDESEVKNEEKLVQLEENSEVKKDEKVEKSEEKVLLEGEGDQGGSGKETDVLVESSKQEEDLEWDEIEDIDSNVEKNAASGEKSNRADLRKRLSSAEEDEDLSWDIEDDDEPIKS